MERMAPRKLPIAFVALVLALFSTRAVEAHSVVSSRCDSLQLYSSEEGSGAGEPILTGLGKFSSRSFIPRVLRKPGEIQDTYHLLLGVGSSSETPVVVEFLGPFFEIRAIQMDPRTDEYQLLVVDKPAARGYRYSFISLSPSALGRRQSERDYSPKFATDQTIAMHTEYGMPDSIYPLLTRVSEGSACDLVMFEERFDEYFRYPEFWVSPRVFLFNSETGVVDENQSKTALYRLTEWADAQHQLQRLINAVSNATHADNVFVESYLSVPRYLWLAKEADQFGEATEKVNQLISIYAELNGRSEHDRPPLMFATAGVDELEVFKEVNRDLGLFSDHEFQIIEQIYRNFTGNEAGTGG
jgi:hypothetical protein